MSIQIMKKSLLKILLSRIALIPTICYADSAEQTMNAWQPEYPLVITVPSNPGGGWDQLGRFLQRSITQEKLSPRSIEVVNKGGAGGIIALAELVSTFDANPYKLMVTGFGMTGASIMHNSEFNLQSTTPIARLTGEFQAIGVPFDSPFKTLEDLMDAFKKDPQKIIWGGGSAGGADHLFINLLANKMGINPQDINYVAFTGGGEATAALMGGQVIAGVSGYSEWGGVVEANRVRLLGISSTTRIVHPDITTFAEIGIDVDFQNWRAIVAAPNITKEQRQYLINLISKARNSATWEDIIKRNNWQDSFLTGDDFTQFIIKDRKQTQYIVEQGGLGSGGDGYASIGPFFFPSIAGGGLLICSLFLLVNYFKNRQSHTVVSIENISTDNLHKFYLASITIALYLVGLAYLGFIYVTPIFIPIISRNLGSTSIKRDIIVAVILTALITIVFEHFLNVIVP
ncbi:tripartite tricarboxylate transporter TctB family protein [Colwellia sp. MSW7]|uniref:Tripartite tricarboxylate transporter TctB family protein n=1 Tax=Colwellia maritima TaxID=2912588 RepID=A0ABS9X655_9GAMM|nr:tripartite tricarboxylate transporter substrate-binding protein [Colwellia maritima]MCI2285706.1 tripartite tricarboxylate transporter TctB family protein [Colwellia maritima]